MIEPTQLPIEDLPNVDSLITEDNTAVDIFSGMQMRLLAESLRLSWKGPGENRPFVVFTNVGLFASDHEPAVVPDVMVALDVQVPPGFRQKSKGSYFTWLYGKPPDVAIEIVSGDEGQEEEKLARYGRIGVPYVVIYDPQKHLTNRTLRVYQRHGLHYTEYLQPAHLQDVGLGVVEWDGPYEDAEARWLRWVDDQGHMLATGKESSAHYRALIEAETARADAAAARADRLAAQRADAEARRADAAAQKAKAEAERAEAEAARAERLAARLRELGESPD